MAPGGLEGVPVGLRRLGEHGRPSNQPTHGLAWSAAGSPHLMGPGLCKPWLYSPGTTFDSIYFSEEKKKFKIK